MRQGFWKFGFLVIINVIFVFWFMVSLWSAVICSYQMLWSPWQLPTRFFYYFACQSVRDTILRHNPAKGWAIFTSSLLSEREHSEQLNRAAQPLMMEFILHYFVFRKTLSQVQPGWDTSRHLCTCCYVTTAPDAAIATALRHHLEITYCIFKTKASRFCCTSVICPCSMKTVTLLPITLTWEKQWRRWRRSILLWLHTTY